MQLSREIYLELQDQAKTQVLYYLTDALNKIFLIIINEHFNK